MLNKNRSDIDFQPAVLIIGYRRHESVREILQICKLNRVPRIYVAVDGPKSESGSIDQQRLIANVLNFEKEFSGKLFTNFRDENIGCAASVLNACDWIFENEHSAIILEDDCIPSNDFFIFSKLSLQAIASNPDIWLSCGTQFAPKFPHSDSWLLSHYALTWGWCTTNEKWKEISISLRKPRPLKSNEFSLWEKAYWNQGSTRAQTGWVDVWDTILVQQLQANSRFAILPKVPLVTNTGNDATATHTLGNSRWLNLELGQFETPHSSPRYEEVVDLWLRKSFFGIRKRHLLTTAVTRMRDCLKRRYRPHLPLSVRWSSSKV
jgi:hypothetical protein